MAKRWSNMELLTLGDLYRDGMSYNEIAVKMNRSKKAIAYALHSYRHVINVEYRRKRGEYHTEMPIFVHEKTMDFTPPKKPWWKVW